jgi:hypothetical protein
VRDVLGRYPDATLRELIHLVRDEHGITMGTSNMARIRQELRETATNQKHLPTNL